MGAGINKVLLPLLDRPLLAWTLAAIDRTTMITWVGLITSAASYEACQQLLAQYPCRCPVQLLLGGATRQASVAQGLTHLPADCERVLIHDGARCLVSPDLMDRAALALRDHAGIITAVPVKDTIKEVEPATQQICRTPPRERLWAAQTPQGFRVDLLREAHRQAVAQDWQVTDDAALFERLGWPVVIVPGEETNLKVTTPLDLALAEFILNKQWSKNHE